MDGIVPSRLPKPIVGGDEGRDRVDIIVHDVALAHNRVPHHAQALVHKVVEDGAAHVQEPPEAPVTHGLHDLRHCERLVRSEGHASDEAPGHSTQGIGAQ
eukprot:scaffold174675_cov41-Tisochrysis_lutea.AAC.1